MDGEIQKSFSKIVSNRQHFMLQVGAMKKKLKKEKKLIKKYKLVIDMIGLQKAQNEEPDADLVLRKDALETKLNKAKDAVDEVYANLMKADERLDQAYAEAMENKICLRCGK